VNKQDYPNERTLLGPIVGIQIWPVECCPVV